MRRILEKRYFFCCGCKKYVIEDDMVSWSGLTKKGVCRACNFKYTLEEQNDLRDYGHILDRGGEQLSMF